MLTADKPALAASFALRVCDCCGLTACIVKPGHDGITGILPAAKDVNLCIEHGLRQTVRRTRRNAPPSDARAVP